MVRLQNMKYVLITGVTSGIGEALARQYVQKGWQVAGTGRREDRLAQLQAELGDAFVYAAFDIAAPDADEKLTALAAQLEGLDVVIANAGIGYLDSALDKTQEHLINQVNVVGFQQTMAWAGRYFAKQGRGHLVGISSLAASFPNSYAPAYNASKAYVWYYLAGLRKYFKRHPADVAVTEIRPGWIDTEMTENARFKFWSVGAERAASEIMQAIEAKKSLKYIPGRWFFVGALNRILGIFGWAA